MFSLVADDEILIHVTRLDTRNKALPYADLIFIPDNIGFRIPAVELSDYRNSLRIRSPYSKINAVYAINRCRMSAKLLIEIIMCCMTEQILIKF